jgi:hypothetical protein
VAILVECLRCGLPRLVRGDVLHAEGAGHCHRCDYVGWAASEELTEGDRRALRDVPLELRRNRPVPVLTQRR